MFVASVRFSICPGCVPPVKTAIVQALRGEPLAASLLSLHLAEVGEVNTLVAFFACEALASDLDALARWVDAVRSLPAGAQLRHVEHQLHHTEAAPAQWQTLLSAASAGVLQQVYDQDACPEPDRTAHAVQLHPLSGRHGQRWLLTPVATHDAALTLCQAASLDTQLPLRDSVLWLPALPF